MNERINFDDLHSLALKLSSEPPFTSENIYVDLLLTIAISKIQDNFDFVLKGGTAIIKTLGSPYRFSYDLDFSYYQHSSPRKHYKKYQTQLEQMVTSMGFDIVDETGYKHREGGRIFILKLIDKVKHLRIPVKLSISSIDDKPCFSSVERRFNPVVEIKDEKFSLLYPDLIPKLSNTVVNVLTEEELCIEKIRALATRGPKGEWSFLLRDIVDLYIMDKRGILEKVLSDNRYQECIRRKFLSVHNTSYWKKFEDFMQHPREVKIREEDLSIFFDPSVIDEKKATETMEKVRSGLAKISFSSKNCK